MDINMENFTTHNTTQRENLGAGMQWWARRKGAEGCRMGEQAAWLEVEGWMCFNEDGNQMIPKLTHRRPMGDSAACSVQAWHTPP